MHFAILSAGAGWHVQDLLRAARQLGHTGEAVDFRRLHAGVAAPSPPAPLPPGERGDNCLANADCVLVRTMPPGSLEQVVFRMDLLHRLQARGVPVINPPAAIETCVD